MNEKKFLDELVAYNLESLKHLEPVPNIDDNLPKDFLEDLEKINKGDLQLTKKSDYVSEFDDGDRGK